jgi:hypothetical protein
MLQKFTDFIRAFIAEGEDPLILGTLVALLLFFSFSTIILFLVILSLRFRNRYIQAYRIRQQRRWDPLILSVMDGSMPPGRAHQEIRRNESIPYLMYLEKYIDVLKGKERDRLTALGSLSGNRISKLLRSGSRKKRLIGIHLMALFQREDNFPRVTIPQNDTELALLSIREMRFATATSVKKKLLERLLNFRYISPIYIGNILADMGGSISPLLRQVILQAKQHSFVQIIAIEALKRMHDASCLDLTPQILGQSGQSAPLLSAWLRYLEQLADQRYLELIQPYRQHPNEMVRIAAVRASIEISPDISPQNIERYFNDPSVQVAINAAEKLRTHPDLPYFDMKVIAGFRWGEIYREMVY